MATLVASVISGAMVEGDYAQAFYFHSMTNV